MSAFCGALRAAQQQPLGQDSGGDCRARHGGADDDPSACRHAGILFENWKDIGERYLIIGALEGDPKPDALERVSF